MAEFLDFSVLGFANGAIYLGIALGLLSVYWSSGVLNFAQAALAMWGAFVYGTLRTDGKYVLPIGTVDLGRPVGVWVSLVLGLATAVVFGAVIHLLIFRPLRRSSGLSQIVASVAVLVTLIGLVDVRFGTNGLQIPQMLGRRTFLLAGARVSEPDLILLGIAVVCALAVGAYFRWTTSGVATRAAASNEDALGLMGYSPHRLDAAAWAIASGVSTLLLILASPSISLNVQAAYYVVPALAILLVAQMRSISGIVLASVILGSAQSLLTLVTSYPWWPQWGRSGLQEGLPFVVAIGVLFAFGDRLGMRQDSLGGGLPKVRLPKRPALTAVLIVGIGIIALLATTGPTRFGLITSLMMAILTLSYTVITGYLGQLSFAQIAFAGAAGFLLSKLTSDWGIEFPWSLLTAALFATILGAVIGVACLRFRGSQLAIVTLAAAVAVQAFVFDNAYFTSLTGNPIAEPRLFGFSLAVERGRNVARLEFGLTVLATLAVCLVALLRWARGRTGRAWLAVRSNERAAASAGINITTTKVTGFALSAFLAGVAGSLIGYSQGQLSTGSFEVDTGIVIFATAFLGGITSVGGAMVAGAIAPLGIVYVLLNNHIAFGRYYDLIAGLGLVLTIIGNPEGIAGKMAPQVSAIRRHYEAPRPTAGRLESPDSGREHLLTTATAGQSMTDRGGR